MAYRAYTPNHKYWDGRSNLDIKKTVKGDVVLQLVSEYYSIEIETMKRVSRKREIVWPRQVCMYLMAYYTAISFKEIGRIFGGKDHTTAMHSKKTVEDLMYSDPDVKEQINFLTKKLDVDVQTRYQALNGGDSIYPGHA